MQTEYTLYRVDGSVETFCADLPAEPEYDELASVIATALDLEPLEFEHVYILLNGEPGDMFVHERGKLIGLPRNEAATRIYRANTLAREPGTDPEHLDYIVGPAIVFSRRIWF